MRVAIDLSTLIELKAHLRATLPDVPSSHRLEALARGIGFNTYAALRAALAEAPRLVLCNDIEFCTYLETHGLAAEPRRLSRTFARHLIARVMEQETDLTAAGYGIAWSYYPTQAERSAAFDRQRAELLGDGAADQFELALKYLSQLERRKSLNRSYSTYNLKHQAERLSRERGLFTHLGNYVSNGVFIAAALASGFRVRRISWDSMNGFVNATTGSIKRMRTGQLVDRDTLAALFGVMTAEAA